MINLPSSFEQMALLFLIKLNKLSQHSIIAIITPITNRCINNGFFSTGINFFQIDYKRFSIFPSMIIVECG